ncbi:MAG: hypothetical protein GXP08_09600 [Gammaproteobacteria bacterium]|nr:hypothetical protein [Gammaproteobacteria bacterium]
MTTDHEPEQQQIDHWLKVAQERVDRRFKHYNSGYYEKKDLPIQTFYAGLGDAYADLARAQFLNGEPARVFRENFAKAAGYILKNFNMAYDKSDPDYVGNQKETDTSGFGYGCVSWWLVGEITFIDGIHYAFMGADFDTAHALAKLFRNRPDGRMQEKEVNRYAHALKNTLLGDIDAAKALLKPTLDELRVKKTKDLFRLNYITLTIPLYGILDNDEASFNKGLALYLALDQTYAQGEGKDTDYEFICSEAVALANLGIHFNLNVTVDYYTLPKGLLIESRV